ncbi:MAG: oligosaccharide flippase family protein [Planctomycetales bacterium]|nr:oligosaccharide flippase family protein [Planctomycetales bacterium]
MDSSKDPRRALPKYRELAGTFAASLGIQVLTIASGVLVARMLQPEGRGVLAAVQLWPNLIAAIGLLGINYSLALRAAKSKDGLPSLAKMGVGFGLATSTVAIAVLWFVGPALLPDSLEDGTRLTRYVLLMLPASMVCSYLQAVDQGAGRLHSFNLVRSLFPVVYLVAVVVFWVLDLQEVVWIVTALIFANVVTALYRVHLTGWQCLAPPYWISGWTEVAKEGSPFLATSVVQLVRDNFARLVLLYILLPADLGLYVVAITSSALHGTLGKSITTIVLPRSSALSLEDAARDSAKIFRVMAIVNIAVSVLMALVLPVLIPLFFGRAFLGAVVPALVLLGAQYFGNLGAILDEGLRGQARPLVGMIAGLCGVLLFGLTSVAFSRLAGLGGVATAATLGEALYCLIILVYYYVKFRLALLPQGADFRFLASAINSLYRRMDLRNA